jgi:uncharacterized protein YndB with AHSA1/START domain
MAPARHTIHIRRPVEDVFAVLTNVELTGRWYPADVEEWWTSAPPHGVGSTRRARVRVLGRGVENDAVVTAYDPPSLAAMKGTSPSAPFEVTLAFAPEGDGTRVVVDSAFHPRGVMKIVAPLFVRSYERGWDRGMANLKRMMEADEL